MSSQSIENFKDIPDVKHEEESAGTGTPVDDITKIVAAGGVQYTEEEALRVKVCHCHFLHAIKLIDAFPIQRKIDLRMVPLMVITFVSMIPIRVITSDAPPRP